MSAAPIVRAPGCFDADPAELNGRIRATVEVTSAAGCEYTLTVDLGMDAGTLSKIHAVTYHSHKRIGAERALTATNPKTRELVEDRIIPALEAAGIAEQMAADKREARNHDD